MFRAAMIAVFLACGPAKALAQDGYPSRLVRIIVPGQPGTTTDTIARVVADALEERWGKTVIVDNVGRAGVMAGSIAAFSAPADGYTLVVAPPGPLAYNHLIYRNLRYDPTKFTPISLLARAPNVLMASNNFPASTLRELIDYAKSNPGTVKFASQGITSTPYLSTMLLATLSDLKLRHIPYRGTPEAMLDLMAGRIDIFFGAAAAALPQREAGKLRILAVGGTERMAAAGDVPTFAEAGVPDFRSMTWFAMAAPPGMGADLASKINNDVQAALRRSDVIRKLEALGLQTMAGTSADASKFFADEALLWSRVIDAHDIHLDAE